MEMLSGKVIVLSGEAAGNGVIAACAKLFADNGARVALLDCDGDAADNLAASLGEGHTGLTCDPTHRKDCTTAIDAIIGAYGRIDALISYARSGPTTGFLDLTPEDYDRAMDGELLATLNLTQTVIPHMRDAGGGAIVTLSSHAAKRGASAMDGPQFATAKAGVLGMTKAIAREFAPAGIRANSVCVGYLGGHNAVPLHDIPLGRAGRPEDVAGCCLFLASDLSAYVTGAEVDVNGGALIH